MKTIGFVISHKNNEKRRGLLPADAGRIRYPAQVVVETGYGKVLGIPDEDYLAAGFCIASHAETLACDIIVDVKLGDADFIDKIAPGKTLVGWAHVVQKTQFTDGVIAGGHTVIAWEDMVENGRYIFYRNRELAGETAILQAFTHYGEMPYNTRVAILGNGQTAHGAHRILAGLGARVDIYPRKLESLFRENMCDYDVLVNCIFWDTRRTDRIIYREDLKNLKRGCMIIDVSCDPNLEIETSRPTTIDDPVYMVDGVLHYAVDNTPAMAFKTVSRILSRHFSPYVDDLVTDTPNEVIEVATAIRLGKVLDPEIFAFRNRRERKRKKEGRQQTLSSAGC